MGRPIYAEVEGAPMYLCIDCFERLYRAGRAKLASRRAVEEGSVKHVRKRARRGPEVYDLVEDYAERIREAREARGWSTSALAQRLRISESMLRKIESGKVKPSIDLARRIEKVLRVKLLEPVVDEETYYGEGGEDYVTLGDIVVVDRDED